MLQPKCVLKSGKAVAIVLALTAALTGLAATPSTPEVTYFPNASGLMATYRIGGGAVELTGPFFKPLAASGRSCGSCHRPAEAWSISPEELKARFEATKGRDPIFRTNDGSNCDHGIDISTPEGRRAAYSVLLDRGLIRIALPVPANAEFEVASVASPYGCDDRKVLSVYRRPLPATNLRAMTTYMWDGRAADLSHQALDAATTHAQASTPLTAQQQRAIVDFEMSLVTAQVFDREAGPLDAGGATGGPVLLATQTIPAFFPGVNDARGGDPHGIRTEDAFRLFDEWSKRPYGRLYNEIKPDPPALNNAEAQTNWRDRISLGQVIFNQKPFNISGVAGLNDELRIPSITGACATCHNTPNIGNHSVPSFMNTGVASAAGLSYLPSMTLLNPRTGKMQETSDPGRAMITGLWKDVGKVKVPALRGLAGRAPYFHNGSAKSIADVVDFYDRRFHIGFTTLEKENLVAFLNAL
jgi:cytochrome c peroxidase